MWTKIAASVAEQRHQQQQNSINNSRAVSAAYTRTTEIQTDCSRLNQTNGNYPSSSSIRRTIARNAVNNSKTAKAGKSTSNIVTATTLEQHQQQQMDQHQHKIKHQISTLPLCFRVISTAPNHSISINGAKNHD
ncbi:conserved hypothetical protein [Ricinus communis]|uniref:Uncharacterized protein n=1 Tax=Ricinus communis TaxID=3988 RepID=B9RDA9_RICCO|nr:conserved hypothetical protein [Ricinus communis]EEF50377.1 conserved hypothetical protein [Ricinus communis]